MINNDSQTLSDIIKSSFDFSGMNDAQQASTLEKATMVITEMALVQTIALADESAQNAFTDFMNTNPKPENMLEYLRTNMPHFDQVLVSEIQNFKNAGTEIETPNSL